MAFVSSLEAMLEPSSSDEDGDESAPGASAAGQGSYCSFASASGALAEATRRRAVNAAVAARWARRGDPGAAAASARPCAGPLASRTAQA